MSIRVPLHRAARAHVDNNKQQQKEQPLEFKRALAPSPGHEQESRRVSVRAKANRAKQWRSSSIICVLEHPQNILNIGSVIRCIDALGISKLYIVNNDSADSSQHSITSLGRRRCCWTAADLSGAKMRHTSASASCWVYTRIFDSTQTCLAYLRRNKVTSVGTSPHEQNLDNYTVENAPWKRLRKVAIWFGNESHGLTEEAIEGARTSNGFAVSIPMCGIVESLNLAVCAGIVLYRAAEIRRRKRSSNSCTRSRRSSNSWGSIRS